MKGQNEIRMIWLMVLLIVGITAWFADIKILSYMSGIAFIISVMQYVDNIQKPAQYIAEQKHISFQNTSKIPLYISSLCAVVATLIDFHFLAGCAITAWIFFFLRWLRRLEQNFLLLQHQIQSIEKGVPQENRINTVSTVTRLNDKAPQGLLSQLSDWLFHGNPVLKVAIVVLLIGVILLLRFATVHWQFSLSLQLSLIAMCSVGVVWLGYYLQRRNRSFALALEGLGLSGLFLCLFFAYYNHVISTLPTASVGFGIIMLLTLWMSLRQQSIELAIMAMMIAYIAPFTLPVREATAIEFVAYYLIINLSVAFLSTLRPWKYLNQIAFLMTVFIAGSYAFYHAQFADRTLLTGLLVVHIGVFVWLGFRFSQLLAKADLKSFQIKPALDIALIFSAPIIGFGFIYLMYFEESMKQAGASLLFALVYCFLYVLAKRHQIIQFIAQSYLSLALIFLTFIPPILLVKQWSVIGWSVEGALVFIYALYRTSTVGRYLGMALLTMAGISGCYYAIDLAEFPREIYWGLCISYISVVLISNLFHKLQQQFSVSIGVFFSLLMVSATSWLFVLLFDLFDASQQYMMSLLWICSGYFIANEIMVKQATGWAWRLPKWFGLIPIYLVALSMVFEHSEQGIVIWASLFDRVGFALLGLLLCALWVRPQQHLKESKEWLSFGVLSSLALTSLTLLPQLPYISIAILPLVFCGWCAAQAHHQFWQTKTSLVLMVTWIICSQLFSQQGFTLYICPLLNPFDFISIVMLVAFIWILQLQVKAGLDRSIGAILGVLGLLWLSSYVLLRALHVYFATPYNHLALWENAVIQLSFTLLWVVLAFITMLYATRKQLRAVWVLGGSILVLVTLKLILFDLSHIDTLTRVISFLGAGFVMLIIAYIAPMPEVEQQEQDNTESQY